VAFRAEAASPVEVPPVLVEVQRFLCTSSVSADSELYHFGMGGGWPCDFYKPLPGVFPSQPSPIYAQETQLLAFSLLGLWCKVT